MGIASKAGDYAFKAFTAGLGFATIYLTATFSVNVYRGLAWHNAQSKLERQDSEEQSQAP
ncbi:Cytochrome c oxidase assembly protein [Senna tora]|uniref:Cytochrome c oxidase assembly protein n=1 Tax=Senna tora TaxID=362788 RepID=A0A834X5E8_9FABA|nr:Cytochrome c oxidase assembly protein [Senna tora]